MALKKQPESKFVQVLGLNLHYLDWGGEAKQPLVLIHGLSGTAHEWDFLAQNICEEVRVYALDQRGHGLSEWATDGYSLERLVAEIKGFVDALGLGKFALLGHSLGGRNTIGYGGQYPETLSHAIICDMAPEMPREYARSLRKNTAIRPESFRSLEEGVAYAMEMNPKISREMAENQMKHALKEEGDKLVYRIDRAIFEITGSSALSEIPLLWELLTKMTCPTWVMRGMESEVVTPELAARMMERIPGGRLVEIPGAGHYIPTDQPALLEKAVREILLG